MSEQDADVALASKPVNPDPEHFYELISTKTRQAHTISQPGDSLTPIYSIGTSRSPSRSKPSITIHQGDSESGPVLGVVKLVVGGKHSIGIGDPDAAWEDGDRKTERITWERQWCANKLTYMTYRFEYESENAGRRERKTFTWRKVKKEGFWNIRRDMELRAGTGEEEEAEVADAGGELLAVWKRTDWKNMKRGVFFIKKREGGEGGEVEDGNEKKKWELMVLLTAFGIVEAALRRG